MDIPNLIEWCRHLSPAISFGATLWTLAVALRLRYVQRREDRLARERVTILIVTLSGRRVALPYRPAREQLSRAELLGVLGMSGRFTLAGLNAYLCSPAWSDVLEGRSALCELPATEEEITVFAPREVCRD